jgi:predicted O-linked N-acetylglucosamine transferase (SPINDLY family)
MDFREHPVSHLIAELIELHDRRRFEVFGFSFGINTRDPMRQRLEKSFDKFLDVKDLSDTQITELSRELEIDIALDLGGHTKDSRPQIFTERAAPIQISYLGYPGTWGAHCMDYLIGDKVVITDSNREHFFEKIIFLPNQFQVNPSYRPIASSQKSRNDYGLPEKSFVFCCFNNNWKIISSVFYQWLRILQKVPQSVLWLYVDNPTSATNLREEAIKHGLSPERVIFAGSVTREKYLEQYKFADLFLDTRPYNAGTTASDALWAGLPVLTQVGESFASRMAASLLANIGIAELITHTDEEYEALAVALASNPEKLANIKAMLTDNRLKKPLFDTPSFTKHIESAYQEAYERYQNGLPIDHIHINHKID